MADFIVPVHGKWDNTGKYTPDKTVGTITAHFEIEVASYRDPFTLPHTKGPECAKVCGGPFGSQYCCEYRMYYQFMHVTPTLIVDLAQPGDFMAIIQECHDSAVAAGFVGGIIAAYFCGGTAVAKAAVDTYIEAVGTFLKAKIPNVGEWSCRVEFRSSWGRWE